MIKIIVENKDFDYDDNCGAYDPNWSCQGCLFTGENLQEFQEWLEPYGCFCSVDVSDYSDLVFLNIRTKNNYLITIIKGNYFLYRQDTNSNFFLSAYPRMLNTMFAIQEE